MGREKEVGKVETVVEEEEEGVKEWAERRFVCIEEVRAAMGMGTGI